ncbi:hypothetical protein D3C84_896120 [compost metagenome]
MGEVVTVGHRFAMCLRGGTEAGIPRQWPRGGKPLTAAHSRFGPGGVHLCEQCLADGARVAHLAVQYRTRQHHLPLTTIATDANVGVLAVEQGGAMVILQQVESLFGIPGTDDPDGSYGHRLITGRLQTIAQTATVTHRQCQV